MKTLCWTWCPVWLRGLHWFIKCHTRVIGEGFLPFSKKYTLELLMPGFISQLTSLESTVLLACLLSWGKVFWMTWEESKPSEVISLKTTSLRSPWQTEDGRSGSPLDLLYKTPKLLTLSPSIQEYRDGLSSGLQWFLILLFWNLCLSVSFLDSLLPGLSTFYSKSIRLQSICFMSLRGFYWTSYSCPSFKTDLFLLAKLTS